VFGPDPGGERQWKPRQQRFKPEKIKLKKKKKNKKIMHSMRPAVDFGERVCVPPRKRKRETETETERERDRERE
jgi:hypothetical protein